MNAKLEQIAADLESRGVAPLQPTRGGCWLRTAIHGRNGWVRLTVSNDDECTVVISELLRGGATGWEMTLDNNVPAAIVAVTLTAVLAGPAR